MTIAPHYINLLAESLEVFGDRWTLLIMAEALYEGKSRFHEFLGSQKRRISSNILTERLERLEKYRILSRRTDSVKGKRVIYLPTEKALDLAPIICAMIRWRIKHDPEAH